MANLVNDTSNILPPERVIMRLVSVGVGYFLSGLLGLSLAAGREFATLIWLPAGLAVAALFAWGSQYALAVWTAAFAVNLVMGSSGDYAIMVATGNAAAGLLGAFLLRRLRTSPDLESWLDQIKIVIGAGALPMAVSAGIGTLAQWLLQDPRVQSAGATWLTWWAGGTVGVMLAAPALLAYRRGAIVFAMSPTNRQTTLRSVLSFLVLASAWLWLPPEPPVQAIMLLLALGLVAWAGFRASALVRSTGVLLLALAGAVALLRGGGPFHQASLSAATMGYWMFMASASVLGIVVAAVNERRRVHQGAKAANERRQQSLLALSSDWQWEQDARHRFVALSGELTRSEGFSAESNLGRTLWELPATNLTAGDWAKHAEVVNAHQPFHNLEICRKGANEQVRWVVVSGVPLVDSRGRFSGYRGIGRDITERRLARLALEADEARFRQLTNLSADWQWEQDANFRFVQISHRDPAVEKLLRQFTLGKTRWELPYVDTPGADEWTAHRAQLERHEAFRDFETRRCWPSGSVMYALESGHPLFNPDGRLVGYRGIGTEITERRVAEDRAQHLAHFDPLTNLPNRTQFSVRLEQKLKLARRGGFKVAVMLLDLDHFKEVNDTLGHDHGDLLLVQAGQRILGQVRPDDAVARLGGDEFIVAVSGFDQLIAVEHLAQRLLAELTRPFQLNSQVAHVSASVGIAVFPDDSQRSNDLLRAVDQAMYTAKNGGRNRFSFFTSDMRREVEARAWMTRELRKAIQAQQFWVAYQPIQHLATGQVHKAEALIRWNHPERGLIGPSEFIPIAESCGLIHEIGDWMFRQAAAMAGGCRESHDRRFQVSVNKSPLQFRTPCAPGNGWADQLRAKGLPGDCVLAEITEGLLLDDSTVVADKLRAFRDADIQVAIDDFGTGFSSLAYLQKHHIDYLKIDRAFVKNLAEGSRDYALCEAIIVMAHKLGIEVIAEGVETAQQYDLLRRTGCDYAQGYFVARPMPTADFVTFLQGLPQWEKPRMVHGFGQAMVRRGAPDTGSPVSGRVENLFQ